MKHIFKKNGKKKTKNTTRLPSNPSTHQPPAAAVPHVPEALGPLGAPQHQQESSCFKALKPENRSLTTQHSHENTVLKQRDHENKLKNNNIKVH